MPLLRGRREAEGATRYRMQEKLFAIGDDFWIENEAGERAYKVDGKGCSRASDLRPRGRLRSERSQVQILPGALGRPAPTPLCGDG